ncbi:MAG: nicotinate-nucleotide adenylyltransferase [Planctomycetota bacterium]
MRLGIYGGTFDPVHYGHLLLAECCREQCRLDEIWFVPAARPPHKTSLELTAGDQRVAMLRLALADCPGFLVSTLELDRGGISYTVDTLEYLKQQRPDAELFFLLGADAVRDLPTWRAPEQIGRLATLVTVQRPDAPPIAWDQLAQLLDPPAWQAARDHAVVMPRIEISSRDLRHRISTGRSVRFRTPPAVIHYITQQRLYRDPGETPRAPPVT